MKEFGLESGLVTFSDVSDIYPKHSSGTKISWNQILANGSTLISPIFFKYIVCIESLGTYQKKKSKIFLKLIYFEF